MALYLIANGATPTTAALVKDTTHNVITTMLQVKLGPSQLRVGKVVEWGISFDGFAAALPIACELFANTVAATVSAHVAAGICNLSDPNAAAVTTDNPFTLTTITTGYNATTEGTVANARMFDIQLIAPTNQYIKQWPLGREPVFKDTEYVRIRVTAGTAVSAYCYLVIET